MIYSAGPCSGFKERDVKIRWRNSKSYIVITLNETGYLYRPTGRRAVEGGISYAEYMYDQGQKISDLKG